MMLTRYFLQTVKKLGIFKGPIVLYGVIVSAEKVYILCTN